MNDVYDKMNASLPHFDDIADDRLKEVAEHRRAQRGTRRAIAINAVEAAREHAGTKGDVWTQNDADVMMAIMELLDRVAGQ